MVLNCFRYEKFYLFLAFFDHIFGTVQYFKNLCAPEERSGKTDRSSVPLRVLRLGISTNDIETTEPYTVEVAFLKRHFPLHSWQAKIFGAQVN